MTQRWAMAFLLCAGTLRAQEADELAVPKGFTEIEKASGKIRVFAGSKDFLPPAQRSAILAGVREATALFKNAPLPLLQVSDGEAREFKDKPRKHVGVVLFGSRADYLTWLGEAGRPAFDLHRGSYANTIGMPVEDGAVKPGDWLELVHSLSHVYLHHRLYFGAPAWFAEGFGDVNAWEFRAVGLQELPFFQERLERLAQRRDDGSTTKMFELLSHDSDVVGEQIRDEAWVLMHFIQTQGKSLFDALLFGMINLQTAAFGGPDAVRSDNNRFLRFLLERAFGGLDKLQEAWDWHRDQLIKNPKRPERWTGKIGSVVDAVPFLFLDAKAHVPAKGAANGVFDWCNVKGLVDYAAPWPGPIRMTYQKGDKRGEWGEEELFATGRSDLDGKRFSIDTEELELGPGVKKIRLVATWSPEGGGVYRVRKEIALSVQGR